MHFHYHRLTLADPADVALSERVLAEFKTADHPHPAALREALVAFGEREALHLQVVLSQGKLHVQGPNGMLLTISSLA